jgi:hypothetical protein
MWSNWTDAISKAAQTSQPQPTASQASQPQPTIVVIPGVSLPARAAQSTTSDRAPNQHQEQGGPNDLFANITEGWNSVVTSVKEQQQKLKPRSPSSSTEAAQSATSNQEEGRRASKHDVFGFANITESWHSVVMSTQETLKQQQQNLKAQLSKARSKFYIRDESLPLDVPALKDAEVCYVTSRLITMGHPARE